MRIESRSEGRVKLLQLKGRLTVDHGAMKFQTVVRELADSGHRFVVLDLGEIEYLDSLGVEALVASYTALAKAGGRLKLANLTPRINRLLEVTKLDSVFEIFDDSQTAIASFKD